LTPPLRGEALALGARGRGLRADGLRENADAAAGKSNAMKTRECILRS